METTGWLRQLHSYGLLRGSFIPNAEITSLRANLRQRERLVEYAAAHIQHMQKALTEMNLRLHHVVSDITGATSMRIIRAIVAGERNPVYWRPTAMWEPFINRDDPRRAGGQRPGRTCLRLT
jgi:hypothetical protein